MEDNLIGTLSMFRTMGIKPNFSCTSQEKVDTIRTPFSHIPYLFCTMAGSFGF